MSGHLASEVIAEGGSIRKGENHTKYTDGPWYFRNDQATGKANDQLMMIKVDDRTWLRVTRTLDGKALGFMIQRLAEDNQSFTSTNLNADGKIRSVSVFEKQ